MAPLVQNAREDPQTVHWDNNDNDNDSDSDI